MQGISVEGKVGFCLFDETLDQSSNGSSRSIAQAVHRWKQQTGAGDARTSDPESESGIRISNPESDKNMDPVHP